LTVLSGAGVRADLIVTSDMVPVITSEEGDAVIAAIAGTGTVYAAHRELTYWARASGADYLLSDEGGGFDLAMNALRAAVRASDGRGQATELVARARQWAGAPSQIRLSDALYNHVYVARPRYVVAGFAPEVLDAAREGDELAVQLIESAADQILAGVCTVARRVNIDQSSPRVVLSGSLATIESPLRDAILSRLRKHLSPAAVINYEPENLRTTAKGIVRLLYNRDEHLEGLRTVLPLTIRRAT
jgi:N-acetylglucosamine kinase-like BadF-type ATPase